MYLLGMFLVKLDSSADFKMVSAFFNSLYFIYGFLSLTYRFINVLLSKLGEIFSL